jgi:hypothetical protein
MTPILSFYGYRLRSELPLSVVTTCAIQDQPPDIVLRIGEIHESPLKPGWSNTFISIADDGAVLIQVAGVARFLISGGNEVTVEAMPSASPAEIESYVMGAVTGVLLHQRALFPLHASCVELGGYAVAIAGQPGSGKSTLAASLMKLGATLLSDDLCAIRFSEGEMPLAMQGAVGLRLWPDSRKSLGIPGDWLPIQPGHAKQFMRFETVESPPRPLAAVIRLAEDPSTVSAVIRRLRGPSAMTPMWAVVHWLRIGRLLGCGESLFRNAMRVADTIAVYELQRPSGLERIDAAARLVAAVLDRPA